MFENFYKFTSIRIFAIVIHYCSAYLWPFIHLTDFYTGSWYRWSHSHSSDSVTLWSGHGANQEEVLSEIPPISRVFYKGRTDLLHQLHFPFSTFILISAHTRMQQINLKVETFGQCNLPYEHTELHHTSACWWSQVEWEQMLLWRINLCMCPPTSRSIKKWLATLSTSHF